MSALVNIQAIVPVILTLLTSVIAWVIAPGQEMIQIGLALGITGALLSIVFRLFRKGRG